MQKMRLWADHNSIHNKNASKNNNDFEKNTSSDKKTLTFLIKKEILSDSIGGRGYKEELRLLSCKQDQNGQMLGRVAK